MPDLGLPRVLAHGERGSTRREPLAGASFGAPFLGFGTGARRTADAPAAHASGVLSRAFCARQAFSMPSAFHFGIGLRGCDSGLQLVAHD